MREFELVRAESVAEAAKSLSANEDAKLIAGGTNLVDLMKEGIERPGTLIDINAIAGLRDVTMSDKGGLMIGALASNSAVAWHPDVQEHFPMISQAILAGATTQIRNMASMGGNLLQKNRCFYYPEENARCNKREPGSGCDAVEGVNRMCAVLGTSEHCIAANPSDLCLPLRALDAIIHVEGTNGPRAIPIEEFHKLPGDTPHDEVDLRHDEMITAIEVPPSPVARNSHYRKLRDRTSYAFALVSVAAALGVKDRKIEEVRLAVGGVGTVPWRDGEAEAVMVGKPASQETFASGAEIIFREAKAYSGNGFKIDLAKRAIVRVLSELSGEAQ